MNKFKNKRIMLSLLILGISIGFAALATTLSILGTANVSRQTWDVHWENVNVVKGATLGETPVIDQAGATVTYEIDLDKPGDTFSFTVDAKNDGSLDAMITKLSNLVYDSNDETTPIDLPNYINYEITYSDGAPISNNQLLKSTQKETYLVTIKYDENHLASSNISLKFKLTLDYQMDDGTGVEVTRGPQYCFNNMNQTVPVGTVCKRAEVLHQEECTATTDASDYCSSVGYTEQGAKGTNMITYGNCGTKGSSPAVGDAFDCDVDNSGTFDEDERFYYISDTGSNEGYATFIYSDSLGNSSYASENYYSPSNILNVLPSTNDWSNPGLNTEITTQLLDQNGNSYVTYGQNTNNLPLFTYTNSAARLLTVQEVENACNVKLKIPAPAGQLQNKCEFLMEKTNYATYYNGKKSWWLATPYSTGYRSVIVSGTRFAPAECSSSFSVRPAIEVDKTKIAY